MFIAWVLAAAFAADEACEDVRFRDLKRLEPPRIVVLGERHGHQPDLRRARRLVRVLDRQAPVRLAIEAVHHPYQAVLDRHALGRAEDSDLPALMRWEQTWGFPWKPYAPLVTAGTDGIEVVAAGLELAEMPGDASVPIPPRYMDVLRPTMGDHEVAIGMEQSFVTAMAWRDHEIARRALDGWSGEGFLVVLTGRGHVEGGKGVAWQLARQTDVPVEAIVLARGEDPPCWPGDRIWR